MAGVGKPGSRSVVDVTMPALYTYSERVYEAMRSQSRPVYLEGDTQESLVYEGFITKLVLDDLKIHVPNYSKVMAALREMGCIEQLRRGGGSTPSLFLIFEQPPSRELWYEKVPEGPKSVASHRYDAMDQRLRDLQQRLDAMESESGDDLRRSAAVS